MKLEEEALLRQWVSEGQVTELSRACQELLQAEVEAHGARTPQEEWQTPTFPGYSKRWWDLWKLQEELLVEAEEVRVLFKGGYTPQELEELREHLFAHPFYQRVAYERFLHHSFYKLVKSLGYSYSFEESRYFFQTQRLLEKVPAQWAEVVRSKKEEDWRAWSGEQETAARVRKAARPERGEARERYEEAIKEVGWSSVYSFEHLAQEEDYQALLASLAV